MYYFRRLILEGLAYCTKSTSSCCVISVSLIQLPAINFSETELPGSRLAISDKLACYYSPIDSHNEKCVVNPGFFCGLCARELRSENLCSVICFPSSSTIVFSVPLPFLISFLFYFISFISENNCSLWWHSKLSFVRISQPISAPVWCSGSDWAEVLGTHSTC